MPEYDIRKASAAIVEAQTKSHYLLKSKTPEEHKLERIELEEKATAELDLAVRQLEVERRRAEVHKYAATFPQLYIGT